MLTKFELGARVRFCFANLSESLRADKLLLNTGASTELAIHYTVVVTPLSSI